MATALSGMAILGGKFSSAMTIPGTPAQTVINDLKSSFPIASRGSAEVVFQKTDSTRFTESEIAAIAEQLTKVESITGVDEVANPFETQSALDDSRADVTDGITKLADAKDEIADGKKELAKAKVDLADGQKKLNDGKEQLAKALKDLEAQLAQVKGGIAQLTAGGAPEEQISPLRVNQAQIEGGISQVKSQQKALKANQKKIDDGYKEIAKNEIKLADGEVEIAENELKLAAGQRLLSVSENFSTVSSDGQTAVATVFFAVPTNDIETAIKNQVVDTIKALNVSTVQTEFSQSLTQDFSGILGIGEVIGLLAAAVILFIMLGSLVAAGLPVISAIVGVGISAAITLSLSNVIEMFSTTPTLGVMLGLAVGIDYSLFILNRHRRQLKMGMPVRESIALANGTSGNAVTFAGLTVIIALVALNTTGIQFLGLMGNFAALAVVVSVLVAVTFTPALLSLVGMKALSKKERAKFANTDAQHEAEQPHNADKPVWATRHPWLTVIAGTVVLMIAAIPFGSMRLGLPDGSAEPTDSTQYRAYSLIEEGFGAGTNGPIIAVTTIPAKLSEIGQLEMQANIAEELAGKDNISAVLPAAVSDDGTKYMFQVIPSFGPTSLETENLVYDLRSLAPSLESKYSAELGVTGHTAATIDIAKKLSDALPLYLGTVLVLSLILLIVVFRSILVPLVASAGFLLSVFATFGSVVAVFQWGWASQIFDIHDPGPILSFLPTIVIGVLFGLAMDYQLFLVSGMREAYVHGKSPKDAVNFGVHLSRSVVVAAALIMVGVFGGFAFSHLAMIKPMGFGLAIGVLFDAFIVRLFLVPAAMTILGKAAWWIPKWLDRLLPNVDVEGAKLERKH